MFRIAFLSIFLMLILVFAGFSIGYFVENEFYPQTKQNVGNFQYEKFYYCNIDTSQGIIESGFKNIHVTAEYYDSTVNLSIVNDSLWKEIVFYKCLNNFAKVQKLGLLEVWKNYSVPSEVKDLVITSVAPKIEQLN